MMKAVVIALAASFAIGLASPAIAQDDAFKLAYHVERTPAARLSIQTCGRIAAQVAKQMGLASGVEQHPGQLVIVRGGRRNAGAFIVQCIAVNATTVSVVQGIDYGNSKGLLGRYAEEASAAIKRAVR